VKRVCILRNCIDNKTPSPSPRNACCCCTFIKLLLLHRWQPCQPTRCGKYKCDCQAQPNGSSDVTFITSWKFPTCNNPHSAAAAAIRARVQPEASGAVQASPLADADSGRPYHAVAFNEASCWRGYEVRPLFCCCQIQSDNRITARTDTSQF
jgi:hypothetical protein